VVNGYRGFAHEISKAQQLTNLETLGLPYPKARVINHVFAGAGCRGGPSAIPVVIKPNIGGRRRRNRKSSRPHSNCAAPWKKKIACIFGIDSTRVSARRIPLPRDGVITRIEVLGGKYLYAI